MEVTCTLSPQFLRNQSIARSTLSKMRFVNGGLIDKFIPYKLYGRAKIRGLGYRGWLTIHLWADWQYIPHEEKVCIPAGEIGLGLDSASRDPFQKVPSKVTPADGACFAESNDAIYAKIYKRIRSVGRRPRGGYRGGVPRA